jgi:hypothetical protein
MSAEDTLKQLLETLTREFDAARAELNRVVDAGRAEAAAAAREAAEADRADAIAQAAAAAEERGRADGRDAGFEAGREAGNETGKKDGYDEGYRVGFAAGKEAGTLEGQTVGKTEGRQEAQAAINTAGLATGQRLVEAIRAIDNGRSLSEILDALASNAGREAARAAVLLVRGSHLRGWRFIGFGPLDSGDPIELALAESGVAGDAVRTGTTASAASGTLGAVPSFAQASADQSDAPPGDVLAVPIPMAGQVIAVLYADQADREASGPEAHGSWQATLEVLARHAARSLEAITAFRAAQVLTDRSDTQTPDLATAQSVSSRDPEDDDQAARRYARLLVSEIKLYHEAEVMAGRRERDLATRLGGEISRARVLYEQRVPAQIRRGTDHFHAELVRTLADGDASLLNVKA